MSSKSTSASIGEPHVGIGRARKWARAFTRKSGNHRRAPRRHRARQEGLERLQQEVAHPLGLFLELRDLGDELAREALGRLEQVVLGVMEAVALGVVATERAEGDLLGCELLGCLGRCGHGLYSTSTLMRSSSTTTGNVSTGTYAGRVVGFPVCRSNSEPWRGHSTVHVAGSNSPSASVPLSCEQRSSMARISPSQLKMPISRSSHSTMRAAPGGSSESGQTSMRALVMCEGVRNPSVTV